MPNDNHEVYNSENICTYTDYITVSNPFTNEQIDACILSAGTPNGFENRGEISNAQNVEQVAANSLSPWYSRSGMYLEYDTQECNQMDPASWQSYYHILYGYWDSGNVGLCTDMDIKKYRNYVTITPASQTYYGHTFDYYKLSIKTQYGSTGDWTDSVLKPILIIPTETLRLGYYIGLDSYKHWAVTEMSSFGFRHTLTSYNSYISFNDGTGGLAPVTCPCSIGADFVWTPTSESDSKWMNDDHYNYGWYDINYGGGGGFHAYSFQEYNNIDDLLMIVAICGLKFEYDGTTYKPIVNGGIVTGYTDDMSEESEWDEWENIGDHTIPVDPTPPPPPPPGEDDDNTDPVSTAGAPFGSGIAHYYAMTADSVLLQHVSEALGTWDIDSSKKDLYKNLISCKLIKPPAPIPVSGSEDFTIYGVVPQYQGAAVKLPVINGNPTNTFGPYAITRKFNDFRDFAPYSKAEIFLPYCGWTALPSHVIGRSVTVKYFTDIIAATCKAVVFCKNNVVAEAAGIIGLDIPFAAENVGAKMEAANMGLLSSTLGAVQTAVGVGTMVSTKSGSGLKNVTSGLSQVISGCTQISMAGNENWTEINGKAGDGCSLSGITNIIIKITRPKYGSYTSPPYVPSGYAHNIGYVAMKQTKPGNVSGLLVCDNVDTSGIGGATQRERELIKAYLESGIIVNAAPTP